jgi:hypothetical protein
MHLYHNHSRGTTIHSAANCTSEQHGHQSGELLTVCLGPAPVAMREEEVDWAVIAEGRVFVCTGIEAVGDGVVELVAVANLTFPTRVQSPAAAANTDKSVGSAVEA